MLVRFRHYDVIYVEKGMLMEIVYQRSFQHL